MHEFKMMNSRCPTLPMGTSNPTGSKLDFLFPTTLQTTSLVSSPWLLSFPYLLFTNTLDHILPYLPPKSLNTFSLPHSHRNSCYRGHHLFKATASELVVLIPLTISNHSTPCQGRRSFWKANLIIYSSQVPPALSLACEVPHGIYISSLNPTATAILCLSPCLDLSTFSGSTHASPFTLNPAAFTLPPRTLVLENSYSSFKSYIAEPALTA